MRGSKCVLVVEDHEDIRRAVAELLSVEGYAVATAANGKEALRLASQAAPDGIVLDLMMPMMDGWGFLACVRTLPACSGLPNCTRATS